MPGRSRNVVKVCDCKSYFPDSADDIPRISSLDDINRRVVARRLCHVDWLIQPADDALYRVRGVSRRQG